MFFNPDTRRQSNSEEKSNFNSNEKRINGHNNDHKSSRSHSSIGTGLSVLDQQQQSIPNNGGRNQLELNKGQERGLNHDQDLEGSRLKTKPVVTSTEFDLKRILTLTPPLTKGLGINGSNSAATRSSLTTTVPSIVPLTQPSMVQSLQPATIGDYTVIQTTTPRFGISSSSILSSSSKTSLKTNTTSSNNTTGKEWFTSEREKMSRKEDISHNDIFSF